MTSDVLATLRPRRSPRFRARLGLGALVVLAGLAGCGYGGTSRPDWVIHSRLVFLERDLRTPRAEPPFDSFRLWFPFILGDLYGLPGTGDFVGAALHPDGTLEIDLNRSLRDVRRSLGPTQLSLPFLRIVPADARIARLAPEALEARGIGRVGSTDWVDADAHERLMLLYVDRPARISGQMVARGATLRYDLEFPEAGYFWVRIRDTADGGISCTVMPRPPRHLVLAVTPRQQ